MSKHTQGELHITDDGLALYVLGPDKRGPRDSVNHFYCRAEPCENQGGTIEDAKARIRMFAASPAMLDALRKAADRLAICCELQPDQKERDTIWAWVEEARNALPRGTP